MHCLSSESLRSLLPNWIQSLWISEGEQNRERLDQTVPTVPSPYTRTEPAVYKLQNSEVAYNVTKPLPVCISNQTERLPRTRTKPLENYISTRPQAISMKFDDNTDCETIVLPGIPPGIEFVKGRITCMGEKHPSPEWSTMCLKNNKLAVIMLSNISQGPSLHRTSSDRSASVEIFPALSRYNHMANFRGQIHKSRYKFHKQKYHDILQITL